MEFYNEADFSLFHKRGCNFSTTAQSRGGLSIVTPRTEATTRASSETTEPPRPRRPPLYFIFICCSFHPRSPLCSPRPFPCSPVWRRRPCHAGRAGGRGAAARGARPLCPSCSPPAGAPCGGSARARVRRGARRAAEAGQPSADERKSRRPTPSGQRRRGRWWGAKWRDAPWGALLRSSARWPGTGAPSHTPPPPHPPLSSTPSFNISHPPFSLLLPPIYLPLAPLPHPLP